MNVTLQCDFCNCLFERRAIFLSITGPHIFCSRTCSSLRRKQYKPDDQKKADKAAYDRIYRARNLRRIKRRKRDYFQKTYDPKKAAIERKKNMPRHVEYCRRPEYRKKKKRYDCHRRAHLKYGDYADCFHLLQRLDGEVSKRSTDYEIRLQQGTLNKKQNRARKLSPPCQRKPRQRPSLLPI